MVDYLFQQNSEQIKSKVKAISSFWISYLTNQRDWPGQDEEGKNILIPERK